MSHVASASAPIGSQIFSLEVLGHRPPDRARSTRPSTWVSTEA